MEIVLISEICWKDLGDRRPRSGGPQFENSCHRIILTSFLFHITNKVNFLWCISCSRSRTVLWGLLPQGNHGPLAWRNPKWKAEDTRRALGWGPRTENASLNSQKTTRCTTEIKSATRTPRRSQIWRLKAKLIQGSGQKIPRVRERRGGPRRRLPTACPLQVGGPGRRSTGRCFPR